MAIKTATSSTSKSSGGKVRLVHVCSECGTSHPKWSGQCSGCGDWNTLIEDVEGSADVLVLPSNRPGPARIGEIGEQEGHPRATDIDELDRVLGGGIVPGSVTLLGGEPGIGKSTLLLQLLASWKGPTLYVTAEESAHQVRRRAERLGAAPRRSVAPRRDVAAPHPHRDRRHQARTRGDRLDPDGARSVVGVAARKCRPGSRLRAPARGRGEGAQRRDRARRPRHQRRWAGRAARARARRRHRVAVRGRSPPRAPTAPGLEAPLRADERARPVRDVPRRARRGARSVHALPRRSTRRRRRLRSRADDGRAPPDRRRGAGADQPRGSGGALTTQRAGSRRRTTVDVDGGARPSQPNPDRRAGRRTRPPRVGSSSTSRVSTSACASPSPAR